MFFTLFLLSLFTSLLSLPVEKEREYNHYQPTWPSVSFNYYENRHPVDFPVVIIAKNFSLEEISLTDKWLMENFVFPVYRFDSSRLDGNDFCKIIHSNPYLFGGFNLISFYESTPIAMSSIATCLEFPLTSYLSWSHLNPSSLLQRKKYSLPFINKFISIWTNDEKLHNYCHIQTLDFDACGLGFISSSFCIRELTNFSLKFLV